MARWADILGWVGTAVGAYYGNPMMGRQAGQTAGSFIDDPDEGFKNMLPIESPQGGGETSDSGLAEMQDMFDKWPGMSLSKPDWWLPLDTDQEDKFMKWYGEYARRVGLDPNPDDPKHKYNYRAWWRAQQEDERFAPQLDPDDGMYHGSSLFKMFDHPNRYIQRDGSWYDTILERHTDAPY